MDSRVCGGGSTGLEPERSHGLRRGNPAQIAHRPERYRVPTPARHPAVPSGDRVMTQPHISLTATVSNASIAGSERENGSQEWLPKVDPPTTGTNPTQRNPRIRRGFAQHARRDSNSQPSDPWISKPCPIGVHSRLHPPERRAFNSTGVHSRPHKSTTNGSQLGSQQQLGRDVSALQSGSGPIFGGVDVRAFGGERGPCGVDVGP